MLVTRLLRHPFQTCLKHRRICFYELGCPQVRLEATQISKFFGISEAISRGSQFQVEANASSFWVRSNGADSDWGLFRILQAAKVLHRQNKLISNLIRNYVWVIQYDGVDYRVMASIIEWRRRLSSVGPYQTISTSMLTLNLCCHQKSLFLAWKKVSLATLPI